MDSTFPANPHYNPSNSGGYNQTGNNRSWQNNQGGGWQGKQGGGGGFPRKPKPEETDPTLYMPYAVAGNKEAPLEILEKFKNIIRQLEAKGYTVRTGCDGPIEEIADQIASKKELLLPWNTFNNKESKTSWTIERAMHIAKAHHPTFDSVPKGVQKILAKNARLIMGDKMMSRAMFLVCWSEDGVEDKKLKTGKTGFVGHTISIANAAGVPIFNLGNPEAEQRLQHFINSL